MTTKAAAPAELPAHTTMVRNILKVYRSATDAQRAEGLDWYGDAHALATTLAMSYDANVRKAAGVISALSPMANWERNQTLAIRLYAEHGLTAGGLKANLSKANAIYAGADVAGTLKAPKTAAFAACIADPTHPTAVVIDRHAHDIAVGTVTDESTRSTALDRKGGYEAFADAYRTAARKVGISPAQMQAITWVVWRQTAVRCAAANRRNAQALALQVIGRVIRPA